MPVTGDLLEQCNRLQETIAALQQVHEDLLRQAGFKVVRVVAKIPENGFELSSGYTEIRGKKMVVPIDEADAER